MRVLFEPVRESEGECAWETCAEKDAEAWRATLVSDDGDVRSWAYKKRDRAAIACANLAEGRPQPLNVSHGMASTGARCAYLP